MLDKIPGEILLIIIETPVVYRLISQVLALSDEFKRAIKCKFAFVLHKKKFHSALCSIKSIEHESTGAKSTIRYPDGIVKIKHDDRILSIKTYKDVKFDTNWLFYSIDFAGRSTPSSSIYVSKICRGYANECIWIIKY